MITYNKGMVRFTPELYKQFEQAVIKHYGKSFKKRILKKKFKKLLNKIVGDYVKSMVESYETD